MRRRTGYTLRPHRRSNESKSWKAGRGLNLAVGLRHPKPNTYSDFPSEAKSSVEDTLSEWYDEGWSSKRMTPYDSEELANYITEDSQDDYIIKWGQIYKKEIAKCILKRFNPDYRKRERPVKLALGAGEVRCPKCGGKGSMDNPDFSQGFTSEEMSEMGDEFRGDYMSGKYDVQCSVCRGHGKITTKQLREYREEVRYEKSRDY